MAERSLQSEAFVPERDIVEGQLLLIAQSPPFAGSPRLTEFLSYIVNQSLDGHGSDIRAKTIGIDLYGYGADDIEKKSTVVRVDAGRVRKKLKEYYSEYTSENELYIDLPKGSYAPVFTNTPERSDLENGAIEQTSLKSAKLFFAAGAAIGLVGVVALSATLFLTQRNNVAAVGNDQLSSIFEDSPARLRAINLAEQGRDLIFPAVDPDRLASALQVFNFVKEEDADYFGGYAGAAQVHSTFALISNDPDFRAEQLSLAKDNADRAKYLAPGAAWSLSAQAWIDLSEGSCTTALRLSDRAARSNPSDPHLAEFDALISLFCDRFDRVKDRVETILPAVSGDKGFVFTNALGSVKYHEGDYEGTVQEFESAIANGGPTGPISLAYLMAAHFRLGETERARELAEQYDEYFAGRRVDLLMSRLYVNPAYGEDLSDAMSKAGFVTN